VTFEVTAPRPLSRVELLLLARQFYAQPKIPRSQKPFSNAIVRLTARLDGAPLEGVLLRRSA
jgi:hypothetical protein